VQPAELPEACKCPLQRKLNSLADLFDIGCAQRNTSDVWSVLVDVQHDGCVCIKCVHDEVLGVVKCRSQHANFKAVPSKSPTTICVSLVGASSEKNFVTKSSTMRFCGSRNTVLPDWLPAPLAAIASRAVCKRNSQLRDAYTDMPMRRRTTET